MNKLFLRGSLVKAISDREIDVSQFDYVSFHAPSSFSKLTEREVVRMLEPVADRGWPIIAHPDAIHEHEMWSHFGDLLCIENMDQGKPIGRTADELAVVFDKLPAACLCLDLAHSKQIDPTMSQALQILILFQDKVKELHVSDLSSDSTHEPISLLTVRSFQRVAHLIPEVPVIIESPIGLIEKKPLTDERLLAEVSLARTALSKQENSSLNAQVA